MCVRKRIHIKLMQRMLDSTSVLFVQGAAYVEFDVHLSKDAVPIIYHDLTCCISTKMVRLSFSFLVPSSTMSEMRTFIFGRKTTRLRSSSRSRSRT